MHSVQWQALCSVCTVISAWTVCISSQAMQHDHAHLQDMHTRQLLSELETCILPSAEQPEEIQQRKCEASPLAMVQE